MKKEIIKTYCDICGKEVDKLEETSFRLKLPIVYHYDDTEFRPCRAYINYSVLDLCSNCADQLLLLESIERGKFKFRGNEETLHSESEVEE